MKPAPPVTSIFKIIALYSMVVLGNQALFYLKLGYGPITYLSHDISMLTNNY